MRRDYGPRVTEKQHHRFSHGVCRVCGDAALTQAAWLVKMKTLDPYSALEELCRATGKWGMYVSIQDPDCEHYKAIPYLDIGNQEHGRILVAGTGYFLFDAEDEMEIIFQLTVGDDGPTETNPYNGTCRTYAYTCGPDGQGITENT